jgi:hypothetical protein
MVLPDAVVVIIVNDNNPSRVAITADYTGVLGAGNDLLATPTQWVHVKMEIADQSKTSGLSFEQGLMTQEFP